MIRSNSTRSGNAPEVLVTHPTSSVAGGSFEVVSRSGSITPTPIDLSSYQTEEEKEILDIVDKVREFDINHELQIPQIVVCGDQSAGKSSVLEAVTKIQFPRGSGTCTRYVTESVYAECI